MKVIRKLAVFASAALLLGACSQETVLTPDEAKQIDPKSNEISFGTYSGKAVQTRAVTVTNSGTPGSITTALELAQHGGFGVFAYYTGTDTYGQYQKGTYTEASAGVSTANQMPNFMYNQKITGSEDATPAWTYSPIKYWPNEVASGDVDTQPATTPYENGGNVSFFAYAPYVSTTTGTVGITGMSANNNLGDPTITYTITDGSSVSNVDLLWGTYWASNTNVLSTGNAGVSGDGTPGNDLSSPRTYAQSILGSYKTNADLTKQKTEGKIGFAFKHALAGFGGGTGTGKTGFQAILDIDNNGAISGGSRESFDALSTNDAYRTIVTIVDVEISNDLDDDGTISSTPTDERLHTVGTLNLATGQWTSTPTTTELSQTIGTNVTASPSYDAELSQKLAEFTTNQAATWVSTKSGDNYKQYFLKSLTDHPGVTETPQNVFQEADQSPLMFIPGTTPKFRVTVDYIVRTYDENLYAKYSEVRQKISKVITFVSPVELNKHYNILMHLGLTGVKFTATVDAWTNGQFDGDGDGNDDDNEVYLPINVQ